MNDNYIKFLNSQNIPNIKHDPLRYVLKNNLLNDTGLILEFGTWKGQSLDMISEFTNNNVYGFDTFEGINTQWEEVDMNRFNLNGVIPNKVNQLNRDIRFRTTGIIKNFNSNVNFVKGLFQNTLTKFLNEKNEKITFLHIDCDIYEGCKTIFNNCNKFISNNCIIVFDELVNYYGFENGEYKAFYEWVKENNIEFEWIGINGKVLSFEEIKFINNLNIDNSYTIYNNKVDWFQKARIMNIRCSVALRITSNPYFAK